MPIVLKDIKKIYPGSKEPVIEGLNLTIKDGSFTVLLGPSGCGKTTTLRMIAGLEDVTSGTITVDNKDITRMEPGDRNLAMVFQNYAIYPHMSVKGNIEFGLKNYKMTKEQIARRITEVLELTGLTEFANRMPNQLSGGQRQRVALARAISKSPKAFLMDEPLSNLDAKLRNQMRSELIQMFKQMETTFVYVTHDQVEALTMATDIVVMHNGRIMQQGSPKEIYKNPQNIFVAQFIGDPGMNVISLDDGRFIGFKPRGLKTDGTGAVFSIEADLLTSEFLGFDYQYTYETGMGKIVMRSTEELEPDQRYTLYVQQEDLFFFDKDQTVCGPFAIGGLKEVYHAVE